MPQPVLITNGILYDGTGAPGRPADVLVRDGMIAQAAPGIRAEGAQVIDAGGGWITPGFLDIHTHYDAEVEVMPGLEESVRHGVTTVVFGNCSLSAAVGTEKDLLELFCRVENMPREITAGWLKDRVTWKGPKEYYEHLDRLALGPNVATFLGHSNIRIAAMGYERSLEVHKPTASELEKMKSMVREAMEAGYLGLSIDMLPWHRIDGAPYAGVSIPSQQARFAEYSALADVVRRYRRVFQATPNALVKSSVLQVILMSMGLWRPSLRTTMIASMDVVSNRSVWKLAMGLAWAANKMLGANFRWQALAEPFLNFADGVVTPLCEELPSAVRAISSTPEERQRLFADPVFRAEFRREWTSKSDAVFHRKFEAMEIVASPEQEMVGKSIAAVASEKGLEAIEFFMDMIARHDRALRWKTVVSNDRPGPRRTLLAAPYTLPGFNDSGAHNRNMAYYDGALQMLKQAQENPQELPVEKAVHKLTGLTAEWLGLDVGTIRSGARADVVVLDPGKLSSGLSAPIENCDPRLSGAMRLVKRSDGVVRHVLVGGETVFSSGEFAPDLHQRKFGRLLRSKFN